MVKTLMAKLNTLKEDSKSQATLRSLIASTELYDHGERRKNASMVRLTGVKFDPFIGTKMLRVFSESENNWDQVIETYGVDYSEARDAQHSLQLKFMSSGVQKTMWYAPLSFSTAKVSVRCSCYDFIFTFAYYNLNKLNALTYASLKPYIRKTLDRPPRNPQQLPGVCKHLVALINVLGQNGIFK